jgi:hypothetical protein
MKPGSDTSLLQKDAESAAASSEHENANNQQREHRRNSKKGLQGTKKWFSRLSPLPAFHEQDQSNKGSLTSLLMGSL